MIVSPVVLAPGRERDATSPAPTMSSLIATIGIVGVACCAILGVEIAEGDKDIDLHADQFCGKLGQLLQAASRIAQFD